jgi:N-acylglucosamine 2-epimerase
MDTAKSGIDFLRQHAVTNDKRVYFSLTEDGKPIYMQRKIFSECFYAMALSEYGKASGEMAFIEEAKNMLEKIWDMVQNPENTGRPHYSGTPAVQSLAVPMILLNIFEEISEDKFENDKIEITYCINQIKKHVVANKVYENIGNDGNIINSSLGRLLNPGHAVEAGWFLNHWALRLGDSTLSEFAVRMIDNSFQTGWDTEYGGLFYFLDADGFSPVQLEWDMKLWWPQCEAMYAHLLNYTINFDSASWINFLKVKNYAFQHFRDPKFGEWFGYCNRKGEVTHKFKGGPFKGCFHVPRALLYSIDLLKSLFDNLEKLGK